MECYLVNDLVAYMPANCAVIRGEGTLSGLIFYEAKEECEEGGTPRSPYDLPGDVRVTCDVLVAPLVQLTLIMDPRVGIGKEYQRWWHLGCS